MRRASWSQETMIETNGEVDKKLSYFVQLHIQKSKNINSIYHNASYCALARKIIKISPLLAHRKNTRCASLYLIFHWLALT